MVQLLQKHAGRGVETNNPTESEDVIERHKNDWDLGDCNRWTFYCLPEGISQVAAVPLLDSDNS